MKILNYSITVFTIILSIYAIILSIEAGHALTRIENIASVLENTSQKISIEVCNTQTYLYNELPKVPGKVAGKVAEKLENTNNANNLTQKKESKSIFSKVFGKIKKISKPSPSKNQ